MRAPLLIAVIALGACHAQPAPPAGPATCPGVADHVRTLFPPGDEHAERVRDVMAERCLKDHWDPVVLRCMLDERDLHAGHHCQDELTGEQRSAFARDVVAIDLPPPPAAEPDLPVECGEYQDAVNEIAQCDKVPQAARDAVAQELTQIIARIGTTDVGARAALAASCKIRADALRQALATDCPP